jgi:hypothetical protein
MTTDRPMDDRTGGADETPDREGGAWIGQHPDPNTEQVREHLEEGAERVAVTANESGDSPPDGSWPHGHRQGNPASDDDVRRAGDEH